jgi:hypothetical protein
LPTAAWIEFPALQRKDDRRERRVEAMIPADQNAERRADDVRQPIAYQQFQSADGEMRIDAAIGEPTTCCYDAARLGAATFRCAIVLF